MKLVVFDLDGTLAGTNSVDEECFIQAFRDTLSISDLSTDWLAYDHATDESITQQVYRERFGRLPLPEETARITDRFVELLGNRHASGAADFLEVPGAAAFVSDLRRNSEWMVALATGSWRQSATFKIQCAGLPIEDIPAAFAEDGPSRESIVQTAVDRATEKCGLQSFDRIVSVGDAVWDVRTARNLSLPFVGVADAALAVLLRENGALHVLEDFLNSVQCMEYLEQSKIPRVLR